MKKSDRQKIFDKYDGHCAYCGCELTKGWHVDELLPVRRKYKHIDAHWKHKITGEISLSYGGVRRNYNDWIHVKSKQIPNGCEYPERLVIENQMPTCASCNINKHSMSLEEFRSLIEGFMKHLNELNTQYKIAKRYGLVKEDIKPIVFYFEIKN
jgi:5-methylcytosine-specific restriction endonuclease McrA